MLSFASSIRAANQARKQNPDSIRCLEERLAADPYDEIIRVKLIGYCWKCEVEQWLQHVLWLIKHLPEAQILRTPFAIPGCCAGSAEDQIGQAWKDTLESKNQSPQVLSNAAYFYSHSYEDYAQSLLESAISLDPRCAEYKYQLYSLLVSSGQRNPPVDWNGALELCKDCATMEQSDSVHIINLALLAMEAKGFDLALESAQKLLKLDSSDFRRVRAAHVAHSVLGRLALAQDKIDDALMRLEMACSSFKQELYPDIRPDLLLPSDLIRRGFLEPVLLYLNSCEPCWPATDPLDESWIDEVSRRKVPRKWDRIVLL